MKLIFAIKRLASSVGGAERVLCTVCSALAARGHEVVIVTFDPRGGAPFYPLDDRVRRLDLSIGDSSQPAAMLDTLRRMQALRRTVLAERPDVAVGFMHSMFVPLAFALVGTAIPVLGSEHIVPEHYRSRPLQYILLIAAAPLLAKVTVLSEVILSRYPRLIRERMVTMPNPVETVSIVAEVGSMKKSFILLSVGRLDPQKDHATLLRAFAQIAPTFPEWHLRIIGEGSLRDKLEHLMESLDLQEKVTMPGVTAAIDEEYRAAEAFVIPSRYEAFGLVTAEAMSHGLPVVGFADCPGTNELINDDRTGLLVIPGIDRAHSLARTLSGLMADPDLRRRLGNAGRQAIDERFSLRHVCDLWEGLLKTVAGCGSSSPVRDKKAR